MSCFDGLLFVLDYEHAVQHSNLRSSDTTEPQRIHMYEFSVVTVDKLAPEFGQIILQEKIYLESNFYFQHDSKYLALSKHVETHSIHCFGIPQASNFDR